MLTDCKNKEHRTLNGSFVTEFLVSLVILNTASRWTHLCLYKNRNSLCQSGWSLEEGIFIEFHMLVLHVVWLYMLSILSHFLLTLSVTLACISSIPSLTTSVKIRRLKTYLPSCVTRSSNNIQILIKLTNLDICWYKHRTNQGNKWS